MRVHGTKLGAISTGRGLGDQLYDLAGEVPSLDLNFAGTKTLDPRVTFTRASSGTFVGSNGVLRSAVTNLLLWSEGFNDAAWTKSAGTVSANSIASPTGAITADTFVENTSNALHRISGGGPVVAGSTYTTSVYAKYAGRFLYFNCNALHAARATFDLQSGTVATVGAGSAAIVAMGNGWYRCSVTGVAAATATDAFYLQLNDTSVAADKTYTGDGTSGLFLWGAQLEQSSTVGEYVPTTSAINSAPRFDHNPTTGESLGLLVEEARTNLVLRSEAIATSPWFPGANTTLTNNTGEVLDPAGGSTATKVVVSGGVGAFGQPATLTAAIYAGSIWLRCATGTISAQLIVYLGVSPFTNIGTTNVTITTTWQRFSVVTSTATAASYNLQLNAIAIGTVYAWGAQLEAGSGPPTSYIPTTSATATRSADVASITGANFGTTRTNLLVRSEEFDNASWSKASVEITPNQIASPSGSITADLVTGSAGTTVKYLYQVYAASTSGTFTFSVFAKAGTESFIVVRAVDQTGTNEVRQRFDLSSGTLSGSIAVGGTATSGSASMVAFGNGWYRCTVTATFAAFTQLQGNVWLNAYSSLSLTTNFYLWGAQLETGSAVTPYIQSPSVFTSRASSGTYVGSDGLIKTATTNEARYDHDPVSLIGKGLLLEGASTNLFLNSEDFSNPTWTPGSVTVTANAATAPTGATTADSLLETSANTEHLIYNTSPVTFTTATQSVYVKPNGRTNVALRFYGAPDDWVARVFSLTGNGSVTQSSAGSSSGFSAVSSSIVNAGNGWYRISMTATQTSRSVYVASPDLCTSSTPTLASINGSEVYAGDITKGVYVWGAQLETTSTVSSYIPTAASTVTRAADISTSVATSVFESSWYNQTEGTVFAEGNSFGFSTSNFPTFATISDGTNSNKLEYGYLTSSLGGYIVRSGNATVVEIYPNITANPRRAAFAAAANNYAVSYNGASPTVDTAGAMPVSASQMQIGSGFGGGATNNFFGTIKRLTYFPVRLGNEVLQRISQP